MTRAFRALLGLALLMFAVAFSRNSQASTDTRTARPPSSAPTPAKIAISAAPIFGQDAAPGQGWTEIVVRIDNVSESAQKGTLQVGAPESYSGGMRFVARAPYNIPAGRSAVVRMPMHSSADYRPPLNVIARNDKDDPLAVTSLTLSNA